MKLEETCETGTLLNTHLKHVDQWRAALFAGDGQRAV